MKPPYIIESFRRFGYVGPFACIPRRRVWGLQWVVVYAGTEHGITSVSFNGNSKQRRQQRRAMLRALNTN